MPEFLHLDDDLAIVNKPSGTVVHPGWTREGPVLMQEVRDALGAKVHPVHRLDRGASGCVVFARTKEAARLLNAQFATHNVDKEYLAIVRGVPAPRGRIDHAIPGRDGGERVPAATRFELVASTGRYSLVRVFPESGRLHQIRRHMKHISCPLIGDVRYGKGEHNRLFREHHSLHRLALHARSIRLLHPSTGAPLKKEAPLRGPLLVTVLKLFAPRHGGVPAPRTRTDGTPF